jgi:hypothetical protein
MITWGGFKADFSNLSNRLFFYPLMFLMVFASYWIGYSSKEFSIGNVSLPLLVLNVTALAHLASEKIDKIADRITIELGGIRRRLFTRMCTVGVWNIVLVAGCELLVVRPVSLTFAQVLQVVVTGLVVVVVSSTLGVLVTNLMPHPIFAILLTFVLLVSNSSSAKGNVLSSQVDGMVQATTFVEWFGFFGGYLFIWAVCWVFFKFVFSKRFNLSNFVRFERTKKVAVPSWLEGPKAWWRIAFRASTSDLVPFASLLVLLALYGFGIVRGVSRVAEFASGSELFGPVPALFFMQVIPAMMLSNVWQKREVWEQESLIYASQRRAFIVRVCQSAAVIALVQIVLIGAVCPLVGVSMLDRLPLTAMFWAVMVSPGLAALSLMVIQWVRIPLFLGLVSTVSTMSEIPIVVYAPDLANYLPSSLYSGLLGVRGPFQLGSDAVWFVWSLCFVAVLYLPLVFKLRRMR